MQAYRFSLVLLASVAAGAGLGLWLGPQAAVFKPIGDTFLNLLFTAVVPLVFFSIAAAVSGLSSMQRLGKIMAAMLGVFVATGILASLLMAAATYLFPQGNGLNLTAFTGATAAPAPDWSTLIAAPDFYVLLSRKSMLALILFAGLVGAATLSAGREGENFRSLLASGDAVFQRVMRYLMYGAPLGLGAYFAYLTGVMGPQLVGMLGSALALYYAVCALYLLVGFSAYAWWADRKHGLRRFWGNVTEPLLLAFGTGSSVATIPSNIAAARRAGVPADIADTVIPIGATIHMDGSCISSMLKLAILYALLGRDFFTPEAIALAVGASLLSGMVMSGIPGGGFVGEALLLTLYGFPAEAMPLLAAIGTLVDPIATAVNAVGDNVASLMVQRLVGGSDTSIALGQEK